MADNKTEQTEPEVVTRTSLVLSVKLKIRKAPRESDPMQASDVMTDWDAEGKNAAYALWCRYPTFEQAWKKGFFKVERYDPSNRVKEGWIDKTNRGLSPVPEMLK